MATPPKNPTWPTGPAGPKPLPKRPTKKKQRLASHWLDIEGTGFFSHGRCPSCDWVGKGHPDEIRQSYEQHHKIDRPVKLDRIVIPQPTGWPEVDAIERRLIATLAAAVTYDHPNYKLIALGLSLARAELLSIGDDEARGYVADLTARITHMVTRRRAKLLFSKSASREQQQILLEET